MSKPVFRLTYEEAKALNPCSLDKIPDFGRRKYMTPQLAFDAGVSVSDFMWLLGKTGQKWVAVKMALIYAQKVASLNTDPRVQAAIDAAWECVNDPSCAARAAADAAAYAAYAAARAAADAARAARAARAAAYAAYAAAYTARAVDAAADAAYAAYAARAAARATARAAAYAEPIRWIDVFNEAIAK